MRQLKKYLTSLTPGPISETSELESLLADYWDNLAGGNAGGMTSDKLYDRIENACWEPPLLNFEIERHGGLVLGSTRAERQGWLIDVNKVSATCHPIGHRQLKPRQANWDATPIAEEIAKSITDHEEDDRIRRNKDGSVRILIGKILPEESAVKQTLIGRRKRFRNAVDQKLNTLGWIKIRNYAYAPPAT